MKLTKWDERFLSMASLVGSWSKDPSTKCGCVIARGNRIISLGYNGYPTGLSDNCNDPRELKYEKTIHSEVNAILHSNVNLVGCTLYVVPLSPCSRCASIIIQSGITKVISKVGDDTARWDKLNQIARSMFLEAGVILIEVGNDRYNP